MLCAGLTDSGFRIQESGFRSQDSGVRIQDSGFRIQESGVRIQDSGFRSQEEVGSLLLLFPKALSLSLDAEFKIQESEFRRKPAPAFSPPPESPLLNSVS